MIAVKKVELFDYCIGINACSRLCAELPCNPSTNAFPVFTRYTRSLHYTRRFLPTSSLALPSSIASSSATSSLTPTFASRPTTLATPSRTGSYILLSCSILFLRPSTRLLPPLFECLLFLNLFKTSLGDCLPDHFLLSPLLSNDISHR